MMLLLSAAAASCFALGGWFMKLSAGVTRFWPTAAFLALFAAGAVLQAFAMRDTSMGAVYVIVLGLEAVLAVGLGVLLLGERLTYLQVGAISLIVAGVALLRR